MTEPRGTLAGVRILLGVTGGVAAYKAPEIVRTLVKEGARVSVILTRYARRFVTRDALRAVTRGPVLSGLFEPAAMGEGPWFEGSAPSALGYAHIGMAREADLVLVAPATANLVAKLAHGLADDLLSTALLATHSPVLIAPAMNVGMWDQAAVQENIAVLRGRGVSTVGPEEGELADGEWGVGRMASIEAIARACRETLAAPRVAAGGEGPLRGRRIVITAGGTEEPIDAVRVITNRSSGKMGIALAEAARDLGAHVRLIVARITAPAPAGIPCTEALTAGEMAEAVHVAMRDADALVMAAAVSDFTPARSEAGKIPRKDGLTLTLRATDDILASVRRAYPKKRLVGFAIETRDLERGGLTKLRRKGLDLIAVNNPLAPGAAFGSDYNAVTLIDRGGVVDRLSLRPKPEVARAILMRLASLLGERKAAAGKRAAGKSTASTPARAKTRRR